MYDFETRIAFDVVPGHHDDGVRRATGGANADSGASVVR